jgi:hypothetical protein
MPRAFLAARVWCDQIPAGVLGHLCREDPPPHELLVFILRNDNTAAIYETLLARVRR